jgi:hypothetical protein
MTLPTHAAITREKDVRDRPDQRQPSTPLANDLVAGCERDHLLELQAERDGSAVKDVLGYGGAHCGHLRHSQSGSSLRSQ